jgi:myosin heavy subunit
MWAMTNRHKDITKQLLDHGASTDIKSSSGRTALDFAAPNSEMADYLQENGYQIGDAGMTGDDFYDSGFSQDRFEQELEEQEMRRRMMMDSSRDLEVDLSSLGMDERPEVGFTEVKARQANYIQTPEDSDGQPEFVWDRCLYDQMFVFQEEHLNQILDTIITNMTPQRSASQKPVPANIIFLSARYAHYHATQDLLAALLTQAMDKINDKVERCQWDMTVLAFWMSNGTLLLYYLKRDPGLAEVTGEFQAQLSELLHEIFILIIRDAERRMDRILDVAMLEHETIPGFEDVQFSNDWNIFRSNKKTQQAEPLGMRPELNARRTTPNPRNITSLLSSTLFVLDLYDVHSVITAQILAQLYYWLGAELFNHVMTKRKYLARTKAMQIRMNVSSLEDWARNNSRKPEHYEEGAMVSTGETTVDSARKHLMPVIQLLQWLQCFSSLGDDPNALENTLNQMTRLTPQQLQHAVHQYRFEVGEKALPKPARKRMQALQSEFNKRRDELKRQKTEETKAGAQSGGQQPNEKSASTKNGTGAPATPSTPLSPVGVGVSVDEEEMDNDQLLMDPSHMLNFGLPTSVDLRLGYGAGYGGVNRERERKYIPTVPPEFLAKLEGSSGKKKEE